MARTTFLRGLFASMLAPSCVLAQEVALPGDDAEQQTQAIIEGLPDLGGETEPTRSVGNRAAEAAAKVVHTYNENVQLKHQLLNGLADKGLDASVDAMRASENRFLRNVQGAITYDAQGGELGVDLSTVGKLYGRDEGHALLAQFGVHNHDDRPTANIGLVHRWVAMDDAWFVGGNVFFDYEFRTGTKRLGVGLEGVNARVRVFLNTYKPLSDWHQSPLSRRLEERPARGMDLGYAWSPRRAPGLELQLKLSKWKGESVDVFATGEGLANPTTLSAKVGYQPVSLVGVDIEHEQALSGPSDTRVALQFNYKFGEPLSSQVSRTTATTRDDIRARAEAPVERNNRIVMETREKFLPFLFVGPSVVYATVRDDESWSYLLQLFHDVGLPYSLTLSGPDAGAFELIGHEIRLAPRRTAGDGTTPAEPSRLYVVEVSAIGPRDMTAHKRFEITVVTIDTDGDGLADADEENIHGTDPGNADTDGDGIDDGTEIADGTDPNDPNDPAQGGVLPSVVEVVHGDAPLTGPPQVGQQLRARVSCNGRSECTDGLLYQWQIEVARGAGTFIDLLGATEEAYTVRREDQHRKLRVVATRP